MPLMSPAVKASRHCRHCAAAAVPTILPPPPCRLCVFYSCERDLIARQALDSKRGRAGELSCGDVDLKVHCALWLG